jgi:deoxyribose-phosphate aldolase
MNIASFIDHTILKASTTDNEVDLLCEEALQHHFAAVCVPPLYVGKAHKFLKDHKIPIATVIGFPFGYTYTNIKAEESQQALTEGATEIDMVISIAALKNKDYDYVESDIAAVLKVVRSEGAVLKVIIESGVLTDDEIIKCCEICSELSVDFLKTSTGYAEKSATIEAVVLIREHLSPSVKIKASGGIRTYNFARQLIESGADRLGCSASVAIVKDAEEIERGNY